MKREDCWNRLDEINDVVHPHGSRFGERDLRVENINCFLQDFLVVDKSYRAKGVSTVGKVKKNCV